MSRNFMALMTPTQKIVPIIRQGTLVYMTPSVVPYCESDCNMTEAQVNALMSDVALNDCDIELRGITDVADDAFDHIAQIHSLIAAAKDKAKTKPNTLDKTKKRADYKNSDYWIVNEDKSLLIRHHVKQRQNLMGFRYLRGELPVAEKRLTGHRTTERFFLDGSSDVIVDEDFRVTDDDKVESAKRLHTTPWRGRTTFKLTPLQGRALATAKKAAEKFQEPPTDALQKNRFRLSQAKSQAKATAKALPAPALSDVPSSSHRAPPAQPIVSDPRVSSRGTEMEIEPTTQPATKLDRQHIVTTKNNEKQIMSQLRSCREFNRDFKDLIVRLFYTEDPQTGQIRTTDHWVQTPAYWIRMVHQERDDLICPDRCPSPLSSADKLAFGDTLIANRYTCILESNEPQKNGIEINDHWCNYIDETGIEKAPEEGTCKPTYVFGPCPAGVPYIAHATYTCLACVFILHLHALHAFFACMFDLHFHAFHLHVGCDSRASFACAELQTSPLQPCCSRLSVSGSSFQFWGLSTLLLLSSRPPGAKFEANSRLAMTSSTSNSLPEHAWTSPASPDSLSWLYGTDVPVDVKTSVALEDALSLLYGTDLYLLTTFIRSGPAAGRAKLLLAWTRGATARLAAKAPCMLGSVGPCRWTVPPPRTSLLFLSLRRDQRGLCTCACAPVFICLGVCAYIKLCGFSWAEASTFRPPCSFVPASGSDSMRGVDWCFLQNGAVVTALCVLKGGSPLHHVLHKASGFCLLGPFAARERGGAEARFPSPGQRGLCSSIPSTQFC